MAISILAMVPKCAISHNFMRRGVLDKKDTLIHKQDLIRFLAMKNLEDNDLLQKHNARSMQGNDLPPELLDTPTPTFIPSMTSAPTQLICPDEYARANECVQNTDSCVTCISRAHGAIFANAEMEASCVDIIDGICPAIRGCDCGDCRAMVEEVSSQ
jgi:hypothetical protein